MGREGPLSRLAGDAVFVGARQLVRGRRPAEAAPSGTRGGHTPVLAHQLASARGFFSCSQRFREKGVSVA